jgi:hypothetical protein
MNYHLFSFARFFRAPKTHAYRRAPIRRRRLHLEHLETRLVPSPIMVTTVAEFGPGSLGDAIGQANGLPGSTIDFAIPGSGVKTIDATGSGLLAITAPVTIDGTSQPGYAGTPLIELVGNGAAGLGIGIGADDCLAPNGFSAADAKLSLPTEYTSLWIFTREGRLWMPLRILSRTGWHRR